MRLTVAPSPSVTQAFFLGRGDDGAKHDLWGKNPTDTSLLIEINAQPDDPNRELKGPLDNVFSL